MRKIGPGQLRVNFNISNAMQEAVLQLIEEQLAQEEITESPLGGNENAELHASGYYSLFVDTVQMMLSGCILSPLRMILQRWHRQHTGLKGVCHA